GIARVYLYCNHTCHFVQPLAYSLHRLSQADWLMTSLSLLLVCATLPLWQPSRSQKRPHDALSLGDKDCGQGDDGPVKRGLLSPCVPSKRCRWTPSTSWLAVTILCCGAG